MGRRIPLKKITQADFNQSFAAHQNGVQLHFKNCDLNGLDLSGKKFASIIFEDCNLNDVDLSSTVIEIGEFKNCLLIGVNFEKADLVNVEFIGCAMQKVNLSHVRIEGVGIKESNLANASLKSSEIEYSDANVFKDVNLHGADLSGTKIGWFSGEKINFEKANLADSSISESQLMNCNFTEASLANSSMYSVAFVDCKMDKSILATAKIENVMFKETQLNDADFEQAEIAYGSFSDSNLDGANFKDASLSSVNEFRNVSMAETDFTGASFSEDSNLYEVDIATAKGLPPEVRQKAAGATKDATPVVLPVDQAQAALAEYQREITLFTARYMGSEVNAEVDGKIAQAMLQQGYFSEDIVAAIAAHSPNPQNRMQQPGVYAANVLRKAERKSHQK
ncbi:pentapeptide repeat-containing protein [Azotosporobacter soli]|uniref:pentapeptide repeat-containing protein n=1 Tax=Azotosporobacter soli TaxID=3055040 RepID=UPI0031FE5BD1